MNLAIIKFKALRIGWNKKPISEKRLFSLAKRLKLKIQEMPLRVPGFYMTMRGVSFVAIDERLDEKLKLKIKFHELAHHVLHTGIPNFYLLDPTMKEECEAEVFSLCAMIPFGWVKKKTSRELIEEEGFSTEMVAQRKEIYEKYKI